MTNAREALLSDYFQAWVTRDATRLPEFFAKAVWYAESHGPEYHGLAQVEQWFADWQAQGEVLHWRIRRFVHQGPSTVVEWWFHCRYAGEESAFDGVTWADFDADGKIIRLQEFAAKAERIAPYDEKIPFINLM